LGGDPIGAGLGFLDDVIGPLAPTPRANCLFPFLFEKARRKSASLEPLIAVA